VQEGQAGAPPFLLLLLLLQHAAAVEVCRLRLLWLCWRLRLDWRLVLLLVLLLVLVLQLLHLPIHLPFLLLSLEVHRLLLHVVCVSKPLTRVHVITLPLTSNLIPSYSNRDSLLPRMSLRLLEAFRLHVLACLLIAFKILLLLLLLRLLIEQPFLTLRHSLV
jgi:hypothetical protein